MEYFPFIIIDSISFASLVHNRSVCRRSFTTALCADAFAWQFSRFQRDHALWFAYGTADNGPPQNGQPSLLGWHIATSANRKNRIPQSRTKRA